MWHGIDTNIVSIVVLAIWASLWAYYQREEIVSTFHNITNI